MIDHCIQKIDIESRLINRLKQKEVRGVKIQVMLSPFDVPDSAVSEFDADSNSLIITFEYTDVEKNLIYKEISEDLAVHIGKTSGRIYQLKMGAELLQIDSDTPVQLKVDVQAAGAEVYEYSTVHNEVREQNSEAVRNILNQYENDIVSPLRRECFG